MKDAIKIKKPKDVDIRRLFYKVIVAKHALMSVVNQINIKASRGKTELGTNSKPTYLTNTVGGR